MKRGKVDEKIMGPMFPRLHINDTEKGGIRAPPRNKMALYEQFSIPTQRFNPGVLPQNPSNNSSLVPPGSSLQGSRLEKNLFSTPFHMDKKIQAHRSTEATLNSPLPHHEQGKKVGDEDDFAVPVFVQAGIDQCHGKSRNDIDIANLSPCNPSYNGRSTKSQNACDKNPKRSSSSGLSLNTKSSVNLSTREKIDGLVKEVSSSPGPEFREIPGSNLSRLNDNDACLPQGSRAGLPSNGCGRDDEVDSTGVIQKEVLNLPRKDTCSKEDCSLPNGVDNDNRYNADKTCGSMQLGSGDKSDDVSETSIVDSISIMDLSPDDVVGVIGHKHFWKARREIVNQQRVFAVQVFELHRLIKVQKLIAGSPDFLLEESAYLGKPSLKASPDKKLPSQLVVKPLLPIAKCKDDSEKPNHKTECSAENAVGKTSLSSVKNGSQPSNYGPYLPNQPPASVAADSRMSGPWCFHQSPGQQWLIPFMSPTEGLIYKPYPGPGYMGPVCGGGCAPFGPTPNFMHPSYGIPSPFPHQGTGIMPGAHPAFNGYFPPNGTPNGTPVMRPAASDSPAQINNQFAGPGANGQPSQGRVTFNTQHESSSNVPAQMNGAVPLVNHFQASKDTELHGSTASSPGERVQDDAMVHPTERSDAHHPVTVSPAAPKSAAQLHDENQAIKVIKVVPHNPRSATASVARIFQSIQEERKYYDSI